jgi:hypothetical protein
MSTILQARDGSRIKPVYLLVIVLENSGDTLYLSDREITVGGNRYQSYLLNMTEIGEQLQRANSEGLNSNLTLNFKNDAYGAHPYLIQKGTLTPFEGATCTISEVYLDDIGTASDAEVLYVGVLDNPKSIDLMRFSCMVSSAEFQADRQNL